MKNIPFHIICLFFFCFSLKLYAADTITGKVLDTTTKRPIPYVAVTLDEQGLWAVTDPDGTFTIPNVKGGNITLRISCLGFVKYKASFDNVSKIPENFVIFLAKDNLQLDEVIVTAKKKDNALTTSYVVDKNAMNHIQSSSVTDIMSQLPGGSTSYNQDLTSEQKVAIREETGDMDNSSFGTAVEVDGIRLSGNGEFSESSTSSISGIAINNLSTSNIESIEIVTGLPSVEYGDLSSGLVSIHTKKGRTPYRVEMTIKPKIKSYSIEKGFDLKNNGGTLNFSLEHTNSYYERASPYKTYKRNNLNLVYKKEFTLVNKPLVMTSTLAGNVGGYNDESDPDRFVNTYEKKSDNNIRGGVNFEYLLNLPWITNIELKASGNYSNKEKEVKKKFDSSSSTALRRSTETGYSIGTDYNDNPDAPIVVVPATASAYKNQIIDNQPANYALSAKALWCRGFGKINNSLKIGGQYTYSGNYGRGEYFEDMRYTDESYREFRYDDQPFINNLALYIEEKISFPLFNRELQLQGGIRNDNTYINHSEYGAVSSLSPRGNVRYILKHDDEGVIKRMCLHAGLGDAVKLPSSNVLYPRPKYSDELVFSDQTDSITGMSYPAYYTYASKAIYNPDLKFQRVRKAEIGIDFRTKIAKFSITAYRDKTFDPYKTDDIYNFYTFNKTDNDALNTCLIPRENRQYDIDQNTGIITVTDKTGALASQELAYSSETDYLTNDFYTNGSSDVIKKGLEWVINFNRIKALNTAIRLDGAYNYYKGIDESIVQGSYKGDGVDQTPFKYLGFYVGKNSVSNGKVTQNLTSNVTFITHIPQIRLIMTMRVEACLYHASQYLSEYAGGNRSYVIDEQTDNMASENNDDIYAGDQYVATAPLYYTSFSDPDTKIPFYDKLLWAQENDINLYNDLVKLVKRSNSIYTFNERRISPYFSANINITKEIGDKISLSFLANNFFNNMAQVNNYQKDTQESLYHNSNRYIPRLYYGLSLRVKL